MQREILDFYRDEGFHNDHSEKEKKKLLEKFFRGKKLTRFMERLARLGDDSLSEAEEMEIYADAAPVWALVAGSLCQIDSLVTARIYEEIERRQESHPLVVDAGCGVGLDLCFLAKKFPRLRFVGYDYNLGMFCEAQKRCQRFKLQNVRLVFASHEDFQSKFSEPADIVFAKKSSRLSLPSNEINLMEVRFDEKAFCGFLQKVAGLVRPAGQYVDVRMLNDYALTLLRRLAETVGFRVLSHEFFSDNELAKLDSGGLICPTVVVFEKDGKEDG